MLETWTVKLASGGVCGPAEKVSVCCRLWEEMDTLEGEGRAAQIPAVGKTQTMKASSLKGLHPETPGVLL